MHDLAAVHTLPAVLELKIPETARAWVDVDLDALVRNALAYGVRVGVPLLPMVKANGYGLGAVAVARALEAVDPWGFGVVTVAEAIELRRAGIERPILICSPLLPDAVEYVRAANARPTIGDLDALRAWLAAGDNPFHLEIDTGMARNGFRHDDSAALAAVAALVAQAPGFEGVYTHFHSADGDEAATARQWQHLHETLTAIGTRPPLVHAANSAAGAFGKLYGGDFARPGIHLYGGETPGMVAEPVAAVRARVVSVRAVRPGETVSYHGTWTAGAPTTVATLGVGYGDGVLRALSNCGEVELNGEVVPIVGRVTMDHLMVATGALPVRTGDIATVFGGRVSLDRQAGHAGTISYELLTALGARLPRRYQGGG
ncbi:MAG: alanine racemase [Gemmatimonadales bacterium]|nr:alanine racemase [Gemmatimonadales bacterium]